MDDAVRHSTSAVVPSPRSALSVSLSSCIPASLRLPVLFTSHSPLTTSHCLSNRHSLTNRIARKSLKTNNRASSTRH